MPIEGRWLHGRNTQRIGIYAGQPLVRPVPPICLTGRCSDASRCLAGHPVRRPRRPRRPGERTRPRHRFAMASRAPMRQRQTSLHSRNHPASYECDRRHLSRGYRDFLCYGRRREAAARPPRAARQGELAGTPLRPRRNDRRGSGSRQGPGRAQGPGHGNDNARCHSLVGAEGRTSLRLRTAPDACCRRPLRPGYYDLVRGAPMPLSSRSCGVGRAGMRSWLRSWSSGGKTCGSGDDLAGGAAGGAAGLGPVRRP
jgi:hypothetical protein